jgi:PAS domain S-box-containing protein
MHVAAPLADPAVGPPRLRPALARAAGVAAAVAAAYALAGAGGLWLAWPGRAPVVLWPAAGVALAAVVRFGWRAVPGVAAGALAVALAYRGPEWTDPVVAAGNVAGAAVGGWVVRRGRRGRLPLDRVGDVGRLLAGAAAGAAVAAAVGPAAFWAAGWLPAADVWRGMAVWWAGDVAGVLFVAPALLGPAGRRPGPGRLGVGTARVGLAAAAAVALILALTPTAPRHAVAAACLPAVAVAATRYGPRGAAAANLLSAAAAAGVVLAGAGGADQHALVAFLAVSAVTGLCLGAITAERDAALARLAADGDARVADRARFLALLEHSHDIVAVLDRDARCLFATAAAARVVGRDRGWVVGGEPLAGVHPDDLPLARLLFADVLAHPGVPTRVEARFRAAAGGWVWLEVIATNFLDRPAVGGVVVNARDVSERRAVETRLRDAQALLEATGRLARIGGWEYVVPEDRLTWSEQTYRIHEVGPADFTPTVAGAVAFYAPEARPVIAAAVERAVATGEGWDLVLGLVTARGRKLWVNAVGQVETRAGRPYRVFGTFQDVTARVEAEKAVGRLEEQFRQAQKLEAVARLAGGVAHDFNNLLTVINGFGEMVAASAVPGSPTAELIGHVLAAGGRAADLTRQLLAFSRKRPPTAGAVDLAAVVEGLRPLLAPLTGDEVRLVARAAPVPPVVADRGQVESVVMNLCVNARDAMPGGGTLTVETGVAEVPDPPGPDDPPPGRWVVLAVTDTGTGIPEEVRPHLFEPFFTTKEVGKGTGLGLPTVYGIVTTAGGHVRYTTEMGKGTTFRAYFPAAPGDPPAAADGPRSAVRPAAPAGRAGVPGRPLVLLVEDQPAVRELSAQVLAGAGFEVVSAADGPGALAALAGLPAAPAVLVTDVRMPRMGGRELADRVRAAHPGVRVLFVSGFSPETVLPAGPTADEAFLAKPFRVDQLAAAVRALAAPTHPDG